MESNQERENQSGSQPQKPGDRRTVNIPDSQQKKNYKEFIRNAFYNDESLMDPCVGDQGCHLRGLFTKDKLKKWRRKIHSTEQAQNLERMFSDETNMMPLPLDS
jgi:hypothetical protein